MSVEAEIKALVESSKIGKSLKEKLIAIGNKKDNEFSCIQAEMVKLKEDYNKKSKTIENNIDQIQNVESSCNKNLIHNRRIDNLENRIMELQNSFSDFKAEFSSKFNKLETIFSKYTDTIQKSEPTEIITNISTKLNFVAEKIEAESEQKLKEKKASNIIIFNIPESKNPTDSALENCKTDLKIVQQVLGENKIKKEEFKSLYRVGKITENKIRPIIIKLNNLATKHRLLKLRNLKIVNGEMESKVYINPDRTFLELEAFKALRKEVKLKQAIADEKRLNLKYVIRNNKIVELSNQPFRYRSQDIWD